MKSQASEWPHRKLDRRPWLLGHRGGAGPWLENSLEAFAGALALGADGVELDVRRAADGTLVVFHDPEIPGSGPVHLLRREALPGWVPTLDRALAACAGAVVNVEIKNSPHDPGYDPSEAVAAEVVGALGAVASLADTEKPRHVIVSSFSPRTLKAVSRAMSETSPDATGGTAAGLPTGLLVHPALDVHDALDLAVQHGFSALHPFCGQVDEKVVGRARDAGMAVFTWTVNDRETMRRVSSAGVDGVITDDVSGALAALSQP